jgi:hypothetical protein
MKFCPVVPEICRGQVHGARSQHSNISKRKKGGVLIKKMRVNARLQL